MKENTQKDLIIKTAYDLFVEYGYNKVTVNDICKSCNITKPTFYYYLDSKEDIISTFYNEVTNDILNNIINIIDADNYWEQLMICFEILIDKCMSIGYDLVSQMYIINLKKDCHTYDFQDNLTKLAISIVSKAQDAGQIRNKSDSEMLYRSSAYAYLGTELKWCIKNGELDLKQRIRLTMENIYDVDPQYRMNKEFYK